MRNRRSQHGAPLVVEHEFDLQLVRAILVAESAEQSFAHEPDVGMSATAVPGPM